MEVGTTADNKLLRTGVKCRRCIFCMRLREVNTDRGFQSQENEEWVEKQGIKQVALPCGVGRKVSAVNIRVSRESVGCCVSKRELMLRIGQKD